MTDDSRRQEEIEALVAIYNEDFAVDSETRVRLVLDGNVQLIIDLPSDYPSMSPPKFELSAPNLSGAQKHRISNRLQEIYLENLGEPVLFSWMEAAKEELAALSQQPAHANDTNDDNDAQDIEPAPECDEPVCSDANLPKIFSGPSMTDRKSAFQAHFAQVTSKEQVGLIKV